MPTQLKSLLADLQRVVQQISEANGKEEGQAPESETSTHKPEAAPAAGGETSTHAPETAPASDNSPVEEESGEVKDLIVKVDGQTAGLVIGVEKNNAVNVESVEVTPEPDGRVSVMIRAKKEQHRQAP
jgi:hypothetical protein